MHLYKYIESKYLEGFIKHGTLRMGTLYDFRKTEAYNQAIGDANEGKSSQSHYFSHNAPLQHSGQELRQWANQIVKTPENSNDFIFEGFNLELGRNSQDFYIFCTSMVFDRNVMQNDFKCDCCIEILDPYAFILKIKKAVRDRAKYVIDQKVIYEKKALAYNQQLAQHPAITKDPIFSNQCEHRTIFSPISEIEELHPFLFRIKNHRKLFRIIS